MRRARRTLALVLVVALVLVALAPRGSSAPPVLPVTTFGKFLTGLSMPALAPGSSGTVGFALNDPLTSPLSDAALTFDVYAFNAFPGNATGPVPASGALTFSGAGSSHGNSVTLSVGALSPGAPAYTSPGTVRLTISAPGGSPAGDYAVRTLLTFTLNGSAYVLESRGFFTAADWANATSPPGSPSELNVSRLGVSGVIPESAVFVRSNPFPVPLALVLAGAVVLAALGGYWSLRRGPGSRSGATAGPSPSHAERAFGKRRRRDGD